MKVIHEGRKNAENPSGGGRQAVAIKTTGKFAKGRGKLKGFYSRRTTAQGQLPSPAWSISMELGAGGLEETKIRH